MSYASLVGLPDHTGLSPVVRVWKHTRSQTDKLPQYEYEGLQPESQMEGFDEGLCDAWNLQDALNPEGVVEDVGCGHACCAALQAGYRAGVWDWQQVFDHLD